MYLIYYVRLAGLKEVIDLTNSSKRPWLLKCPSFESEETPVG